MTYETDALIILVKDKIAGLINTEGKLLVIESYTKTLNQLLQAKHTEALISERTKSKPETSP